MLAEKILSGRERLPARWQVHGTTGYNFLNQVNGLFVHPGNARRMRRAYAGSPARRSFDDLLYDTKRLIMDTAMASELTVLAHMLDRIGETNRKSRDFTLNSIRDMLVEVVACFPIYRTYVDEHGWAPEDRAALERAIVQARRRNPAMESSIFDFFREVMLPRDPAERGRGVGPERRGGYPPANAEEAGTTLRFAMKFQQYTGPLQAKGLEDTAFYRNNLLLSVNEVGGDPSRFGRPRGLPRLNQQRRQDWPYEMIATATHDTKLGEDVRARSTCSRKCPPNGSAKPRGGCGSTRGTGQSSMASRRPTATTNTVSTRPCSACGLRAIAGGAHDFVPPLQAYMIKAVREASSIRAG